MEDAPYDYKILSRPRANPTNTSCSRHAEQDSKIVETRSIFEDALQAYEELKNRGENNSEDWKYDEDSGYYYSESTKMYALWDTHTQDWIYFNNKFERDQRENNKFDEHKLDHKREYLTNSDKDSEEDSIESAREEGQLSDSEACGTASLSNENDTNSNEQNTRTYPVPSGYIATSEERYYFNPENNVWFDVHSSVYSIYDESTQTYTPVDPTSIVYTPTPDGAALDQGEPGSDATLRLVVMESGILKSGHLVLVDANGISMGRDRWDDRRLRLAEMPTSKHHCQIFFSSTSVINNNNKDEEEQSAPANSADAFFIIDIGSQNGTFVNSQRLSESKMSSKPYQLNHMDEVTVGSTIFQVHLHKQWTCDVCTATEGRMIDISHKNDSVSNNMNKIKKKSSDGDLITNICSNINNNTTQKELLEVQRREELNRLKRKYMGPSNINQKHTKYVDRAALRREIHPDNSPVKKDWEDISQVSTVETKNLQTKISSDNKGNKLLQKMGWREGQGLGRNGTGILDPIQFATNEGRIGLGAGGKKNPSTTETLQEATRRVAKERFIDLFQ